MAQAQIGRRPRSKGTRAGNHCESFRIEPRHRDLHGDPEESDCGDSPLFQISGKTEADRSHRAQKGPRTQSRLLTRQG